MSTTPLCRQNFHADCEAAINRQINRELRAAQGYMAIAAFFGRDDVALHGFKDFFYRSAKEEQEHAWAFVDYQNRRGGRAVFKAVKEPERVEFGTPLDAVETALKMEKGLNSDLIALHALAADSSDAHLADFVGGKFLTDQVDTIKQLADLIASMNWAGDAGMLILDQKLADSKVAQ